MAQGMIYIIDDEPGIRSVMCEILSDEGYECASAESGEQGLEKLGSMVPDAIILDVWLPGMDGLAVLKILRERRPETPVIMVSGHSTIDVAVQAVKAGAFDFLEKPLSMEKVLTVITNALEMNRLRHENRKLRSQIDPRPMIGSTQAMQELRKQIAQAAASLAPVWISGENGTGKELVARSIHRESRRAAGAFIAVNCAAIPETLIESELFGHEKGAFTGAIAQKKGRFELADGGTLFLDEVIDLSPSAQVKLLRVLQDMQFERVGGERSVRVDVRVIAASNRDVSAAVQEGSFREDLYYRLHVLPLQVVPLRNRPEDIPDLVARFMQDESIAMAAPLPLVSPEAMQQLVAYTWPGNVRQLRNVIQRIMALSNGMDIDATTCAAALGQDFYVAQQAPSTPIKTENTGDILAMVANMELGEAKDTFERLFLLQKLEEQGYNITRTAQVLGMYPSNLHAKMKKYNLER